MEDVIREMKTMLGDPKKFNDFANERFIHTDVDGNGFIDVKELEHAMNEIAEEMGLAKPPKSKIDKIFKKYDTDKSGTLDKQEFKSFTKMVLENFLKVMEEK